MFRRLGQTLEGIMGGDAPGSPATPVDGEKRRPRIAASPQLDSMRETAQDYEREVTRLQLELEKLRLQQDIALADVTREVTTLKEQLQQSESDNNSLRVQLGRAKLKLQTAPTKRQVTELKHRVTELEEQLTATSTIIDDDEQTTTTITLDSSGTDRVGIVTELETKITELEKVIETKDTLIRDVSDDLEQSNLELTKKDALLQAQKDEFNRIQTERTANIEDLTQRVAELIEWEARSKSDAELITTLKDEVAKQKCVVDELSEAVIIAEERAERLVIELEETRDTQALKIAQFEHQINRLETEKHDLVGISEEGGATEAKYLVLQSEHQAAERRIIDLETVISEKTATVSEYACQVDELRGNLDEADSKLKDLSEQLHSLTDDKEHLKLKLCEMETLLEESHKQIDTLKNAESAADEDSSTHISHLEAKVAKLEIESTELADQISRLTEKNNELEASLNESESALKEAKDHATGVEARLTHSQTQQEQLRSDLDAQRKLADEQEHSKQQLLSDLRIQENALQTLEIESEKAKSKLSTAEKLVLDLQAQISELDNREIARKAEIQSLLTRLGDSEVKAESATMFEEQLSTANTQIERTTSKLHETETSLSNARAELARLRQEADALHRTKDQLTTRLQAASAQKRRMTKQIEELKAHSEESAEVSANLSTAQAELIEFQTRISNMTTELNNTKEEAVALGRQLDEAKMMLKAKTTEIKNNVAIIDQLRTDLSTMRSTPTVDQKTAQADCEALMRRIEIHRDVAESLSNRNLTIAQCYIDAVLAFTKTVDSDMEVAIEQIHNRLAEWDISLEEVELIEPDSARLYIPILMTRQLILDYITNPTHRHLVGPVLAKLLQMDRSEARLLADDRQGIRKRIGGMFTRGRREATQLGQEWTEYIERERSESISADQTPFLTPRRQPKQPVEESQEAKEVDE